MATLFSSFMMLFLLVVGERDGAAGAPAHSRSAR